MRNPRITSDFGDWMDFADICVDEILHVCINSSSENVGFFFRVTVIQMLLGDDRSFSDYIIEDTHNVLDWNIRETPQHLSPRLDLLLCVRVFE